MANSLLISQGYDGSTIVDATTRWVNLTGHYRVYGASGESTGYDYIDTGGTITKVGTYCSSNGVSSASTLVYREETATVTAISVSITGSTTGLFEDTSNSSTVTAGQRVDWQVTVPSVAGNNNIVLLLIYANFSATSDTVLKTGSATATATLSYTHSSTTSSRYVGFGGMTTGTIAQTTESVVAYKVRASLKAENLSVNVQSNTNSGATTFNSRKNSGAGGMAVSIPATTAGNFHDTSGSDTLASGDTFNAEWPALTSGSITVSSHTVELISSSGYSDLMHVEDVAVAHTAGATYYYALGSGRFNTGNSTEVWTKVKTYFTANLTNLRLYLTANAATGNGTLAIRKDTGGGSSTSTNQTISITASTTGWFEDVGDSAETTASGDAINYIWTIGTGGSSTVSMMGCMMQDITFAATLVTQQPDPYKHRLKVVGY